MVFLVLVASHDLVERNLFPVDRTGSLVLDAPLVLLVELVELEALLLDGRVNPDRDRHEAEGDGAFPDRSSHRSLPLGRLMDAPIFARRRAPGN